MRMIMYKPYKWEFNEEVAQCICDAVMRYSAYTDTQRDAIRKKAAALSKKALWKNFFTYYCQAYSIALDNAQKRQGK